MGLLLTGCTSKRVVSLLTRRCMIEGCREKSYKEGLCEEHYQMIHENEATEEAADQTEDNTSDESVHQEQDAQTTEAETTQAETSAAVLSKGQHGQADTLEEELAYIRETYSYANTYYDYSDQEHSLRQKNGYDEGGGGGFSDGFSYYDEDGNLIKLQREDSSSGLRVEAYYINPALGRNVPEVSYLDTLVVFAFATDADGGEYRLYFSNGNVIRYIGPDKQVVDYPYPAGLNWMGFSMDSTGLSGSEQIQKLLLLLSPMWYVPYETGDDDFYSEDPTSELSAVHKSILESVLSRELFQDYQGDTTAYYGSFTEDYVQEAAWDYLFGDYYNASMLMPENLPDGQWGPYADGVYYDLSKVNIWMNNIYGILQTLSLGEVCYHRSYHEISLEVSDKRVTTPMCGGNGIDPFAIAEITAYSFNGGYMDVAGSFVVECGAGPLTGNITMTAKFKVNPQNDFPYQLLFCRADAE